MSPTLFLRRPVCITSQSCYLAYAARKSLNALHRYVMETPGHIASGYCKKYRACLEARAHAALQYHRDRQKGCALSRACFKLEYRYSLATRRCRLAEHRF